jgi:hypothetical protein
MGQDTGEMLALKFPECGHLIPELEQVCKMVKVENGGKARICFDAVGIDGEGKLIVKCFEAILKIFRHK